MKMEFRLSRDAKKRTVVVFEEADKIFGPDYLSKLPEVKGDDGVLCFDRHMGMYFKCSFDVFNFVLNSILDGTMFI